MFASGEPLTAEKLAEACGVTKREITPALERLERRYSDAGSGLALLRLGNSYQIATREEYAPFIKTAVELRRQTPLSAAAMETLAIIAYNQPISKAFVEQVRGIDSGSVVNTLVERGLAEEAGRLDLPGRPAAYRTTENFLRCFGLTHIKDLPPLPGEEVQLSFDSAADDGLDAAPPEGTL